VLLPSLDEIARRYTLDSAAWAFAAHWGAEWLRRATRLAPPPVRPLSVVIGDASRDELDPDSPHIRAFELFCLRAGINVLSISARGVAGIGEAVAVHRPNLIVVAGSYLDDDAVARWAYSIRQALGPLPIALYRRGTQRVRTRAAANVLLPSDADKAQRQLLELAESEPVRGAQRGHRVNPQHEQPRGLSSAGL